VIYVYTSINGAYLANARILAQSVKKIHPEWKFVLLFNDIESNYINWRNEPFDEVLYAHKLPVENFRNWFFKYTVVELCTAVKGVAAQYLFDEKGADKVIYLDPDTVVFSEMTEVETLLDKYNAILTPHLTDAEEDLQGIHNHEIAALKHGTFNLGFYAFNKTKESRKFLDWWANRIQHFSYADFDKGLFTDQKWCNLAPYLFEGIYILKDRSYNVATWNIKNRNISKTESGEWLVNEKPLRFYHFSGFGNNFFWADKELELFSKKGDGVRSIWQWYKQEYKNNLLKQSLNWHWGCYENGEPVEPAHRRKYRDSEALQIKYTNPFSDYFYLNEIVHL